MSEALFPVPHTRSCPVQKNNLRYLYGWWMGNGFKKVALVTTVAWEHGNVGPLRKYLKSLTFIYFAFPCGGM